MNKLVFDASGTTVKFALMDSDANILEEDKRPAPNGGTASFDDFMRIIKEAYHIYEGKVNGIAVSLPGRIDTKSGLVITPGSLRYNAGKNLAQEIRTQVADLPVVVVNDGKAAAAGEYWKGNLVGCTCGMVMLLGSGIGGGIVMGGRVWDGSASFAGEFSYMLDRPSVTTTEGHKWGDRASIPSLIKMVSKRTGMNERLLDGKKVFRMIEAGNDYARAGVKDLCDYIAHMIFNVSCVLDPEKVLLGGSIVQQPLILELVQGELDRIYSIIPDDVPHVTVDACRFLHDGSLTGALYGLITRYPELA